MKSRRQPSAAEPEYLSSTTRAVAWGALFFSLLSFAISSATFFLTYKNGVLVENYGKMKEELAQAIDKARQASGAGAEESVQKNKVRSQLDRYAAMVQNGDEQARYYLDSLMGDLERLKTYSSNEAGEWIGDASKAIAEARDQIKENAPLAAEKLRALAGRLAASAKSAAGGEAKEEDKP